jgi:hypothetical protein
MVRPEGLELSTFWFVGRISKNLNSTVSVTYDQMRVRDPILIVSKVISRGLYIINVNLAGPFKYIAAKFQQARVAEE